MQSASCDTYRQEYLQLLVVSNTLVVGMVALVVALIAGIFFLEIEWDESTTSFWSTYGACVRACMRYLSSTAAVRFRHVRTSFRFW